MQPINQKQKKDNDQQKIMVSISQKEFQRLESKGVKVVKTNEINLTVYTNPKVGWQYKNHLLNETNCKGSKIQAPSSKSQLKSVDPNKANKATKEPACKAFDMKLPDLKNGQKNKAGKPQYQLLIAGSSSFLYNNQPGRWSQSFSHRVDLQLKSIKQELNKATDLKLPSEQRKKAWKQSSQKIENLKSSLSSNSKKASPKKLEERIQVNVTVNNHFFKGEKSVQNQLDQYWKKNGDKFQKSDQEGMKKTSSSLADLKKTIEMIIKQVQKLIMMIKSLMSPKG